jgi:hypothetical protein
MNYSNLSKTEKIQFKIKVLWVVILEFGKKVKSFYGIKKTYNY